MASEDGAISALRRGHATVRATSSARPRAAQPAGQDGHDDGAQALRRPTGAQRRQSRLMRVQYSEVMGECCMLCPN